MKMNLKNKSIKKLNIKLTSKNLFIFLISFSIITILIGIIFYSLLSTSDKETVNQSVKTIFTIKSNINYLEVLEQELLKNTYNIFLIWVLGISVIGVLAAIFIYFCELFSVGLTLASIINIYKVKGILGCISYLLASKICYIVLLFILTFFSVKISYKLIKLCFSNEEINMKKEIKNYFKVLIFSFISIIAISMLTTFIDNIFIKIFTSI